MNRPRRRPMSELPQRGEWGELEAFTFDDDDDRVQTSSLPSTLHTPGGSRGGYPTAEEVAAAMRATRRLPAVTAPVSSNPGSGPLPPPVSGIQRIEANAPISAPPVSWPPPSMPPVPVSAPPISAPPISAPPISAPPISAPPISAPPISAPPISAPVSAPPISAPYLAPAALPTIRAIVEVDVHADARRRTVRSVALVFALLVPVAIGLAYVAQ